MAVLFNSLDSTQAVLTLSSTSWLPICSVSALRRVFLKYGQILWWDWISLFIFEILFALLILSTNFMQNNVSLCHFHVYMSLYFVVIHGSLHRPLPYSLPLFVGLSSLPCLPLKLTASFFDFYCHTHTYLYVYAQIYKYTMLSPFCCLCVYGFRAGPFVLNNRSRSPSLRKANSPFLHSH